MVKPGLSAIHGSPEQRHRQHQEGRGHDQAAKIFEEMSLADNYPEFLTLPLYEAME